MTARRLALPAEGGTPDARGDGVRPLGRVVGVVSLVASVAVALAVLTGGMRGPLVLHDVREHLVVVGLVAAGLWLVSIRGGLRAELALGGALLTFGCVLGGGYAGVSTEREVALEGSPARASVVHRSGLVDGETCVVARSGRAP